MQLVSYLLNESTIYCWPGRRYEPLSVGMKELKSGQTANPKQRWARITIHRAQTERNSGPLSDQIDTYVEMPRVPFEKLAVSAPPNRVPKSEKEWRMPAPFSESCSNWQISKNNSDLRYKTLGTHHAIDGALVGAKKQTAMQNKCWQHRIRLSLTSMWLLRHHRSRYSGLGRLWPARPIRSGPWGSCCLSRSSCPRLDPASMKEPKIQFDNIQEHYIIDNRLYNVRIHTFPILRRLSIEQNQWCSFQS